jgi:hypothetical protein
MGPWITTSLVLLWFACMTGLPHAQVAAPGQAPQVKPPEWLTALIKTIESEAVSNPPSRIIEFQYRGQTVYYRPPRCCDIPGELYDAKGAVMCSPDGGFTGRGDGKCADFFDKRTDEKIVWTDKRKR